MAFSDFATEINSLLEFIGNKLPAPLYSFKTGTMPSSASTTTWVYTIAVDGSSNYDFEDLRRAIFYFESSRTVVFPASYAIIKDPNLIIYELHFHSAVGGGGKMCAETPINTEGSWDRG